MIHRNEISEPIYHATHLFLVGGDADTAEEEARIWFKEKGSEPLDELRGVAGGFTIRGTGRHFVIWRENMTDKGTMVHEINHAAIALFEDVGIPINRATDEAFTHYTDWLAENCPAYLQVFHE
jgi:hypothetical protein